MSVATEQTTTKHFVDLFAKETILRRQRIVIEVPADWDATRLAHLDGEELSRLADESGCDAPWEYERVDGWKELQQIKVFTAPDNLLPDIKFRMNKIGDLIEAGSGEIAAFVN